MTAPARPARRLYAGVWRRVVRWLRVPEEPPQFPGPDDGVESFRPDAGFLGYLKFWFWFVALILDLALLAGWIVLAVAKWWLGLFLLPPLLVLLALPHVVLYIALHLRFDTTWYVLSDESLRIRRGVWIIREMTVTFENVQNLEVTQGPLQRLFGISNLHVETAGGSSSGDGGKKGFEVGNEAIIEGVANAPELRDRILARLRRTTGTGLGDDEPADATLDARHVQALREVLEAVRRLPPRRVS